VDRRAGAASLDGPGPHPRTMTPAQTDAPEGDHSTPGSHGRMPKQRDVDRCGQFEPVTRSPVL
jgi:hypothetical protein